MYKSKNDMNDKRAGGGGRPSGIQPGMSGLKLPNMSMTSQHICQKNYSALNTSKALSSTSNALNGPTPSGVVLANDFKLFYKIGSGSFGEIFLALNMKTKSEVAVKVESTKTKPQSLVYEAKVYSRIRGGPGIPQVYYFGADRVRELNILVMDLLGPSLEDLFKFCGGKFTYKTTIMLADQMIERVEWLHSKNLIHRDIKPDNFMMGIGVNCNTVFLADYGLAKRYRNSMGKHIKYRDDKCLTGTARYASVNTHYGSEQSRRDDLESLGYVFLYFMKGKLPWQNLKSSGKNKYEAIAEKKASTPIHVLCQSVPVEFQMFLQYTRGLKFDEQPDYSYLRMLFRVLLNSLGYEMDYVFDWTHLMQKDKKQDNSISSGYASSDSNGKRGLKSSKNDPVANSFRDSTAKLITDPTKPTTGLQDPDCTLTGAKDNDANGDTKKRQKSTFGEWLRLSFFRKSSVKKEGQVAVGSRGWFSFKRSKSNIQLTKSTSAQNLDRIDKNALDYGFYSNTLQPKKTANLPNRHNSSGNIPAIYGSQSRPGGGAGGGGMFGKKR